MKNIDLTCVRCGAVMTAYLEKGYAECEYCGHRMIINREQTQGNGGIGGVFQIPLTILKQIIINNLFSRLIICMLALPVIVYGIAFSIIFPPVSEKETQPAVNPFACIEVSFQGEDGYGTAIIERKSTEYGDGERIDYDISKDYFLCQGDTVIIQASSAYYHLTETEKTYVVKGLDEYLKDPENIPEDALELIHRQAESVLDENLEETKNAGVFLDMVPVKLYLTTDGKQNNELYDVFEAHFQTRNKVVTYYVVVKFDDVLIRDREQVSLNMFGGTDCGNFTEVEDDLHIWAYNSLEEIRTDILTSQETYMELKECDLKE